MIKKIQIRFIRAAMLSVAIVLAVIMGTVNLINYRSIVRDADRILALLEENDGSFPDRPSGQKPQSDASDPDSAPDGDGYGGSKPDENAPDGGEPDGSEPDSGLRMADAETPFESRYFTVTFDASGSITATNISNVAAVDEETARSYAGAVRSSSKTSGFYGAYRYAEKTTDDGGTMIIFLDCRRSLENFHSFLITTILVSAFGMLAVFLLVLAFSGRIVKPAEESLRKQKRFITDAGHELKTPLTIIDADSAVLEMDTGENEWLDDIKKQTRRLTGLTNDLVYLSRMDEGSGRLTMIDFPISDVVSDTAHSFVSRAQVEGKNFSYEITPMLSYNGDEKAITKLVTILLDNAMKYSDDGGTIRLTLKKGKNRGIEIQVFNTADSMDSETLQHMFDRFYRADKSRNSEKGGYGIGLSIAQAVASAHHGKISASSADSKSVLITVFLP